MPDTYREVEHIGWFAKIQNSFFGAILGIILFLCSFGILYSNEARVDLSQVARKAVEISATASNNAAQSKLVSVTGAIASSQLVGDNLFLKPGKYIAAARNVEMFAWSEKKETDTKHNTGGSDTKITDYKYSKNWVEDPQDSSKFRYASGHENPPKSIKSEVFKVNEAKVGIYSLAMSSIELPTPNKISLSQENIKLNEEVKIEGNYLYQGQQTLTNPQIGDLRIQYSSLNNGENVTVFGKLESGDRIAPYIDKKNVTLHRIFAGNRDESISQLKTEHDTLTWILRLVGFIIMWIGLAVASEPLAAFLDLLPFIGWMSRNLLGFASFAIALILSTLTILVSILLQNIIAVALAAIAAITAGIVLKKIFK